MIYRLPAPEEAVDQGDILDGCPFLSVAAFDPQTLTPTESKLTSGRAVVLTQACDLANQKATRAIVAVVLDAQFLVEHGVLKAADVRGPIRACRVWGWYFLPANEELGLPESIVDLRQLHTVRLDLLTALCQRGQRLARIQPLYREHLAKHFADTYSRIGLPEPYPTE
jgi:hypothetical protein